MGPSLQFYGGRTHFLVHSGGHGCTCNYTTSRRGLQDSPADYTWVPKSCRLWELDPLEFCDILGNRTILLVGDSTMQQSASTLMNGVFGGPLGCQTQIMFGLADTLVHRPLGNFNRGKSWLEWVEQLKPSIVIIAAGAHINSTSRYLEMITSVVQDIKVLRAQQPSMQVLWKTIQHAGCHENISDSLLIDREIYSETRSSYNYAKFLEWDAWAKSVFQSYGVPIIDLQPLYYRTDAHPSSRSLGHEIADCLHSCLPGPLDIFPTLVYHALFVEPLACDSSVTV